MPVTAHGFLEAAGATGLINFEGVLVLVDLEEGADVVGLGQQEAVVAGPEAKILFFEVGLDEHGGGRPLVAGHHVDSPILFVLLCQELHFALELFYLAFVFADGRFELLYLLVVP